VIGYAVISLIPLVWIFMTSLRIAAGCDRLSAEGRDGAVAGRLRQPLHDAIARPRRRNLASLPLPKELVRALVREQQMILGRPVALHRPLHQLAADRLRLDAAVGRAGHARGLRLLALSGAGQGRPAVLHPVDADDAADRDRDPVYLMFRNVGLNDTHVGLILLYTVVNLSLSVWLLQGFMDEIPREYEEAAMVDGYTRWQAFVKVVLPQAATGIATTAIFCLIFAWNEYAFALL
jgi:multiple sugar transport system permease protein